MANRGKFDFLGIFLFCLVLMNIDSTSGGVSAPTTSSRVRPPHVVHLNPTRVTIEVPSVVYVTGYPRRIFSVPVPFPVNTHPRKAGTRRFWYP
jgi:hypothetical protein